jgi:hypothetical protein
MADHRLHGPRASLSQPSPEIAADPVPRQIGWQDLCLEKPASPTAGMMMYSQTWASVLLAPKIAGRGFAPD